MSWSSSRPTRQSSSSPMRHFLEHQSGCPTQASLSVQGAAAQANLMLMPVLGPSWLPSSLPPRRRPPHHRKVQFPLLRWYSSRVRSSAFRGQHPSFPHRYTRTLLVSWRQAGTLKSQLRCDAKALTQLTGIISDGVQVITWIIFSHSALVIHALGILLVCADSLVHFHVNRTVLEPLVL